jgi:hypothetical protein
LILSIFDISNKCSRVVCCIPFKSQENEKKFVLTHRPSLVLTFWVIHNIRVKIFFLHNIGLMGIKRRRILRRIHKHKLTLVTKMKKKLFLKKRAKLRLFLWKSQFSMFLGITKENLYF